MPLSEAGDYIAGYTIANDFGLHDFRDTDAGSMLRVKGSDTMAPLGPGLVTGWDFRGKRLRTYVNGSLVQDGSTAQLGGAHVAMDEARQIDAVLDDKRLIKSIPLPIALHDRRVGGGTFSKVCRYRVPWHDVRQNEPDDRHAEAKKDEGDQATGDKEEKRLPGPPACDGG